VVRQNSVVERASGKKERRGRRGRGEREEGKRRRQGEGEETQGQDVPFKDTQRHVPRDLFSPTRPTSQ
jgi:hypothetical protein